MTTKALGSDQVEYYYFFIKEEPNSDYLDWDVNRLAEMIIQQSTSNEYDTSQVFKTLRSLRRLDVTKALDLYAVLLKSRIQGIDALLETFAHDLNKRMHILANKIFNSGIDQSEKRVQATPLDDPEMLDLSKRVEAVRLALLDQGLNEARVKLLMDQGEFDQALEILCRMPFFDELVILLDRFLKDLFLNDQFSTDVILRLMEIDVDGWLNDAIVTKYLELDRLEELEEILKVMKGDKDGFYVRLVQKLIKKGSLEKAESLTSLVTIWPYKCQLLVALFEASNVSRVSFAKRLGSFCLSLQEREEFLVSALTKVQDLKFIELFIDPQNRDNFRKKLMDLYLQNGQIEEAEKVALSFECPNDHQRDTPYKLLANHFLKLAQAEEAVRYLPKFTSFIERESVFETILDLLIDQGSLGVANDLMFGPYQLTIANKREPLIYRLSTAYIVRNDLERGEHLALQICDKEKKKSALQYLLAATIKQKNGPKIEEISRKLVHPDEMGEEPEDPSLVKDAIIRNHWFKVKFLKALEQGQILIPALHQQTDPFQLNAMTSALLNKFPNGEFLRSVPNVELVFFPDIQDYLILHFCNRYMDQGRIDDALSLSRKLSSIPLTFTEKVVDACLSFDKIAFLKKWVVQTHLRPNILQKCVNTLLEKGQPEEAIEFVKLAPLQTLDLLPQIARYYMSRNQLAETESLLPLAAQHPVANDMIVHELLELIIDDLLDLESTTDDQQALEDISRLTNFLYHPRGEDDYYLRERLTWKNIQAELMKGDFDQAIEIAKEFNHPWQAGVFIKKIYDFNKSEVI